jgi:hypothetical protein
MPHHSGDRRTLLKQLTQLADEMGAIKVDKIRLKDHDALDVVLSNKAKFRFICNPNPMNRLNNLLQFKRKVRELTIPTSMA